MAAYCGVYDLAQVVRTLTNTQVPFKYYTSKKSLHEIFSDTYC